MEEEGQESLLINFPSFHRAPKSKQWTPHHIFDPPKGQSAAELAQECAKLEPAPNLSQERGTSRNRTRPRKNVDYFATLDRWRILRKMRRRTNDQLFMRPNPNTVIDLLPSVVAQENYMAAICNKYVHTVTNKIRSPVNIVKFTSEGRRVMTGATSGEFTMWNGMTFNFETILQAHDSAVRCAEWSHSGIWLVSGDSGGVIKYFQNNMNNLQAFQAHPEAVRDVSLAPNDTRFVTGADDSTIKIWSFEEMREEKTLTGHGWDVKCVKWHPTKGLLVSGSKDNMVKFWDPRSGKCLSTLHGHRNTVQAAAWNPNGNSVATASRDSYVKVYDIRAMKELVTFKGHKKEVCSLAWHPFQHSYLVSGGSEGSILHWSTESLNPTPVETLEFAHESNVWSLDFHPLGHLLASASNDHTTRFWVRPRPGVAKSSETDRYHVGREQSRAMGNRGDDEDEDDYSALPGLGAPSNNQSWQNGPPPMNFRAPIPFNAGPGPGPHQMIPGFQGGPPPMMGLPPRPQFGGPPQQQWNRPPMQNNHMQNNHMQMGRGRR